MTAQARQSYTIDEIKWQLVGRLEEVLARYAPPASGSYRMHGLYWTLNPGRADRSVGSFCVHLDGPKAGRWIDYATGQHGDAIDLIALSLGLSPSDAIREARAFLGLEHESPDLRRARAEAAAAAKERARLEEARRKERAETRRKWAEGLFLASEPQLRGTPVAAYLRGRGIDLERLGRQPGAIRYHHAVTYQGERVDPDTGEVCQDKRRLPAMVAAIADGSGRIIAAHRTYLARRSDGSWSKAPLPDPKKVLGDYRGGSIRLSSGTGPRGGKAPPLSRCPAGTRVYIAEGIETGLSAVMLMPEARVLAAVSLSNMAAIDLPKNVAEVVLISDGDDNEQARAAFDAAVQAHAKAGRVVRVWRPSRPGEDLNDALQRALAEAAE